MKKWIMLVWLGASLAACQTRENTQTLENSDTTVTPADAIDDNYNMTPGNDTIPDTASVSPNSPR